MNSITASLFICLIFVSCSSADRRSECKNYFQSASAGPNASYYYSRYHCRSFERSENLRSTAVWLGNVEIRVQTVGAIQIQLSFARSHRVPWHRTKYIGYFCDCRRAIDIPTKMRRPTGSNWNRVAKRTLARIKWRWWELRRQFQFRRSIRWFEPKIFRIRFRDSTTCHEVPLGFRRSIEKCRKLLYAELFPFTDLPFTMASLVNCARMWARRIGLSISNAAFYRRFRTQWNGWILITIRKKPTYRVRAMWITWSMVHPKRVYSFRSTRIFHRVRIATKRIPFCKRRHTSSASITRHGQCCSRLVIAM